MTDCHQLDFLPFTCDCCKRLFCMDHRSYASHTCPKAPTPGGDQVIVCPLCAKGVRLAPGQDPNAAFEEHSRTQGCDTRNYARVHAKPRCPVGRCSEKLTLINTYTCKACGTKVCLKHRMPDDHGCAQAKAANAAKAAAARPASASAGWSAPWSKTSGAAAVPVTSAQRPDAQAHAEMARKQTDEPSNSVKGTAQRRQPAPAAPQAQQQQQQQQRQRRQPAPAGGGTATNGSSNANPLVPAHLPEECPQCRARFATVDRLVAHVEEWHPSPAGGGAGGGGGGSATTNPLSAALGMIGGGGGGGSGGGGVSAEQFRCDTCRRLFDDPVALLMHADHCARRAATAATAAQGGSGAGAGKGDCVVS
ncbi:hypothetical protein FOA52_007647 [Chlamydomonas sp. UWO 241]|nr:hypothetical protein FOA52_007647 [Chlamydomonas sp. UWO 241]